MALWKIERVELDFDQVAAFVIRAESEAAARAVAAANCRDEGPRWWTDPERSTCELLDWDVWQMALWKIERLECDCDQPAGFVIRAQSEKRARVIAATNCRDEGPKEWTDPERSTCELVEPDGPEGVILRDFWEA